MHESFLTHARNRYLWVAIVLLILSITLYVWHDPVGSPSGGSWLGYTLGTIGGVLILWLMMFGAGPGPGESPYAKNAESVGKKAVKCDMCKGISGGAACVRSCPTGAAIRISPEELISYAQSR